MPPSRRPTMRDVAEAAGVSLKTVSRVVNNDPSVSSAVHTRVQRSISELGFSRNELARSLRPGQRSTTVGLLIGDVCNPFYSRLTRAVDEVARTNRHMVLLVSSEEDPHSERRLVLELCERRVDGLIIVPSSSDHSYLEAEMHRGLSVVFVDRPAHNLDVDTVLIDDRRGAADAVRHLIAHGHRRIGHVGDRPTVHTAAERLAGFREVMAAAALPVADHHVAMGATDADAARVAAASMLDGPDPPTALFTGNNLVTHGALQALHGHREPVALVGFDDFDFADMLPVPVTVVGHDSADVGLRAASLLFDRIAGHSGPGRTVVIPTQLVARGSGEIRPTS